MGDVARRLGMDSSLRRNYGRGWSGMEDVG